MNIDFKEAIGLCATLLILISLLQSSTLRLRILNMIGSITFTVYGLLIGALSVWILNGISVFVNIYHIYRICKPKDGATTGCVILGYQGVGKTTVCQNRPEYIDLESSNFRSLDGSRSEDWYVLYCKTAISLAKQGYVVFTATHAEVQRYIELEFQAGDVDAYICFPSKRLGQAWTRKLKDRYELTQLDKDYRAWRNAEEMYQNNIDRFHQSPLPSIMIGSMHYDLDTFIQERIAKK